MLSFFNFEANEEVNSSSRNFIILAYALAPICLKLLAAYILFSYKFNEKDLEIVQRKIYG
jgi:Na+/melibiose symporter-like transporter